MSRKEAAVKTFSKGFNCSQAVLSVFCEESGLDETTALKIASGFGGGMRKGEVCGAVTGAIMVLGLKYGHCIEGDTTTKQKANALTVEFIGKFEDRNRTIICRNILGYDISIEEEHKEAAEKGVFSTICPKMIEDVVDILEETLEREGV
ncbi:MAG: C_GCAxxG_C_C family protein [Chitinispirillaceae bacterium]|nr:C_GCAxxG_C_C family protein [Chitinispirillaceae bacterium]